MTVQRSMFSVLCGRIMFNVEGEVLRRYKGGAEKVEDALCCPTDYDPRFLEIIPREIIEKDYGCGDPSKWVTEGETVLDLI